VSLLADDQGAFDEGGARVVDAVEHRLHNQLALKRRNKMSTLGQVPLIESSWLWCGCFNGQQLSSIPNLAIAKCQASGVETFRRTLSGHVAGGSWSWVELHSTRLRMAASRRPITGRRPRQKPGEATAEKWRMWPLHLAHLARLCAPLRGH